MDTGNFQLTCSKGERLHPCHFRFSQILIEGMAGCAMVLGKLPSPGRPADLDNSRAWAFCVCRRCGWGLFGKFFSITSLFFSFLWETARYRLKYCFKRPLSPPKNQPTIQQEGNLLAKELSRLQFFLHFGIDIF